MSALELLQLLGGTLAKGIVLVLAGCAGIHLLRGRSAASRYAVWGAMFAGLLLLPVLTLTLPVLDPPALGTGPDPALSRAPVAAAQFGEHQMFAAPSPRQEGMTHALLSGRGEDMLGRASEAEHTTWRSRARMAAPWLLGAWAIGACLTIGLVARDVRRIAQVSHRAAVLRRGALYDLSAQVAAELGVRGPVAVALTRELAVPVSWGLWRPVVLLPTSARQWDLDRRRVVLRHELAHVRRRDYAGHLLIELACALHWPNPLVWRAAHRARLEQEQACDDRVLGLGTASVEYAQHLLDIARTFGAPVVPARRAGHGRYRHTARADACHPRRRARSSAGWPAHAGRCRRDGRGPGAPDGRPPALGRGQARSGAHRTARVGLPRGAPRRGMVTGHAGDARGPRATHHRAPRSGRRDARRRRVGPGQAGRSRRGPRAHRCAARSRRQRPRDGRAGPGRAGRQACGARAGAVGGRPRARRAIGDDGGTQPDRRRGRGGGAGTAGALGPRRPHPRHGGCGAPEGREPASCRRARGGARRRRAGRARGGRVCAGNDRKLRLGARAAQRSGGRRTRTCSNRCSGRSAPPRIPGRPPVSSAC